jgi:YidC/Oxa1 family membrane protein insertase
MTLPPANILQPLIDVFEAVLVFFHDTIGLGWGFSIIALTIVVRALLLPLTLKQVKSMRGLQLIAPEMKKLQAKYKDDKQRLNQEMMKLYSEHKVNPFASCLPLAAQIPVFISLFYMLRKDLRHDICPAINPHELTPGMSAELAKRVTDPIPCGASEHSQFWFIPDITDSATGKVLIALIILYVGSQLISSLLMMTATADKNQRMIMLVLPFVFVPFVYQFPAGLIMYWITTNVWTIGQQQFLRRIIGRNEPPMPVMPPSADGEGGFFSRITQAMQEAQGGGAKPAPKGATGGSAATKEKRVTKAPPPPPRQKSKKRSGRRR